MKGRRRTVQAAVLAMVGTMVFVSLFRVSDNRANSRSIETGDNSGVVRDVEPESESETVDQYTPVIGVLTQPCVHTDSDTGLTEEFCHKILLQASRTDAQLLKEDGRGKSRVSSYVALSYDEFFDAAGLRVALIPWDLPRDELRELIGQCNGLALTGGYYRAHGTEYNELIRWILLELLPTLPARLPVMGFCAGFEYMLAAVAFNESALYRAKLNTSYYNAAIDWRADMARSLLFGEEAGVSAGLRAAVMDVFSSQTVAYNHHDYGVTPAQFEGDPYIAGNLSAAGVSVDRDGTEFVAYFESPPHSGEVARDWVGVQFHPEKVAFEHSPHFMAGIKHSADALIANLYIGQAFGALVKRANRNRMDDATFFKYRARSFEPVYTGSPLTVNQSDFAAFFKEWVFM